MISLEQVSFTYNGTSEKALCQIDLTVKKGEFIVVTGPSGSGKSTLCRLFNGLVPHFYGGTITGQISVAGLNPLAETTASMARSVGMVFQDPENQMVTSDVEHELCFGMENLGWARAEMAKSLGQSLDIMGILPLRSKRLDRISGGEKQKTAIASVIALNPRLIVLDEPTSELDPQSAEDLLNVLRDLNSRTGLTVVLVEHRLERVLEYASRLVALDKGRVITDSPVSEISASSYSQLTGLGIGLSPLVDLYHGLRRIDRVAECAPVKLADATKHFKNLMPVKITISQPESQKCAPAVQMTGVCFTYPDGTTALKDINLKISPGELVAIMGKNGSGKTTLVKHLNGLYRPGKGNIRVLGTDISSSSVAEMSQRVGLIFQNPGDQLFSETVSEEICFGLHQAGLSGDEVRQRLEVMLDSFGLARYRDRSPGVLSGGEKQRLALASVLACQPPVLVLDEPTRGMSSGLKKQLMEFLKGYCEAGNTVILVTHDVEMVARFCTRVVMMGEGRIICDGDGHDVMPANPVFTPQIARLAGLMGSGWKHSNVLTAEEVMGTVL